MGELIKNEIVFYQWFNEEIKATGNIDFILSDTDEVCIEVTILGKSRVEGWVSLDMLLLSLRRAGIVKGDLKHREARVNE